MSSGTARKTQRVLLAVLTTSQSQDSRALNALSARFKQS